MAKSNTRLELTWIGKENRPKLEPRILVEDPEKSYHAKFRRVRGEEELTAKSTEIAEKEMEADSLRSLRSMRLNDSPDLFDNRLIFGDNLLALKALEQEFTGKIKCIYIDPPFNTQQAFEHYDDGIEHSLWLSLMRDRLDLLRKLLADDGSMFIHIDDNELGYLIPIADEVFGRRNRVSIITFKQGSATGHKSINPGCITNTNFILWYCRTRDGWNPRRIFTKRERNVRYNQFILNRAKHHSEWVIVPLSQAFAESLSIDMKSARKIIAQHPEQLDEFVFSHADAVIQLARPSYDGVSKDARQVIDRSRKDVETVYLLERNGFSDMFFKRGERIIFFRDTMKDIDGELVPGEPLTTLWDDIPSHNLHNEGNVEFPKGKKPEALVKRCIELVSDPGDWVLDSFAGSGTTGAVAHKMGRRWIMVELGEHCHTHIIPRMRKVIDGDDQGGISKGVNWKGGGGFRYYKLGPSLIVEDEWENPVINPDFNAAMLAEAMCKLEGFTFEPNADIYWQQGRSSETDFIYVTTQMMTKEMLTKLSDEVGPNRSLLICCGAYRADVTQFENLTVKKIPKQVLKKCEWGHDDYSLEIRNLPVRVEDEVNRQDAKNAKEDAKRSAKRFGKGKDEGPTLFDMEGLK